MAYDTLLVERDGPVLTVTLNRPPMNAINRAMQVELRRALDADGADDGVRALILTGAGDRAFSVGADITEFPQIEAEGKRAEVARDAQALMDRVAAHPKPIVAALNGYALGGGCELALAAHFRVMADTATIGLPEVRLGLVPTYGGTQRLPRLIGAARALELMLLGERIDADRAHAFGLVHRVAAAAALRDVALELARGLAKQAPLAVNGILTTVRLGLDLPLDAGLALEREQAARCQQSKDALEGVSAFLQKRAPEFRGE